MILKTIPRVELPAAISMAGMVGSTYTRESNFSTMKHIKSKDRNRVTDETLLQPMRIGLLLSLCCTPAGETSSISLRQNFILIHLWVWYTAKSAELFNKQSGLI